MQTKLTIDFFRQYALERYIQETTRTNSLRVSLSVVLGAVGLAMTMQLSFLSLPREPSWTTALYYLITLGIMINLILIVRSVYLFFTGFTHGYPISPKKAKVQLGRIPPFIDKKFDRNDQDGGAREEEISLRASEYMGDIYAHYVDHNQESNNSKAGILVSLWKKVLALFALVLLLFIYSSFVTINEGETRMMDDPKDSQSSENGEQAQDQAPEEPVLDLDIEGTLITEGARLPKPKQPHIERKGALAPDPGADSVSDTSTEDSSDK